MNTKSKIASPLSRTTVLVSVTVSKWTAKKVDKEVTADTNRRHNASNDAGEYKKLLIEKDRLARLTFLSGAARHLHYSKTRPWADEGVRILPNALYSEFTDAFRELKREFDEAADEFAKEFPNYVRERQAKLNGMFKEEDYPSCEEIRSKFKMNYRILPFPEADDFRADLDPNVVADIKQEIIDMNDQVLVDVMKENVSDIVALVGHMAEKLHEQSAKFTTTGKKRKLKAGEKNTWFADSLVENVRELANKLPAFNLTNDPKLAAIIERIQKELCVEEAVDLRKNKEVREAVAKSADEILEEVSKFFA